MDPRNSQFLGNLYPKRDCESSRVKSDVSCVNFTRRSRCNNRPHYRPSYPSDQSNYPPTSP